MCFYYYVLLCFYLKKKYIFVSQNVFKSNYRLA